MCTLVRYNISFNTVWIKRKFLKPANLPNDFLGFCFLWSAPLDACFWLCESHFLSGSVMLMCRCTLAWIHTCGVCMLGVIRRNHTPLMGVCMGQPNTILIASFWILSSWVILPLSIGMQLISINYRHVTLVFQFRKHVFYHFYTIVGNFSAIICGAQQWVFF